MDTYICWHCQEKHHTHEDISQFECQECCETNFVIGTRTMDIDEYQESIADSEASHRYEEAAYGSYRDRDDYYSEPDTQTFRDDKWD